MLFGNYSQLNMLGMGSNMGYQNFLGSGCGFSGFGMNSIFGGCNMFTNCDGSYNYDRMAGAAVGGVLVNSLFGFLGSVIQSKQTQKENTPESELDKLKAEETKLQGDVDKLSEAFQKKESVYNTANSAYEANAEVIKGKTQADYADAKIILANYTASTLPEGTDKPTKDQYNEAYAFVQAWDKKDDLKTAMETAKNEMEDAKKAKEAKERELQAVTNKIEAIETENKTKSDDNLLDKADGHNWQQTGENDYNTKFNENNELNSDAKVSKGDIRAAIQRYRIATTPDQKRTYAMQFAQLWNKLSVKDQSNDTLFKSISIIRSELSDEDKAQFDKYLGA